MTSGSENPKPDKSCSAVCSCQRTCLIAPIRACLHPAPRRLTFPDSLGSSGDHQAKGARSAPSAGSTYPLELYLLVEKDGVKGINPGFNERHLSKLLNLPGELEPLLIISVGLSSK